LIALHSPVFGYCPENESLFVGETECQPSLAQDAHGCHCEEDEQSAPGPCDGEHELICLDSGDFVWSGMGELGEARMSLIEDLGFQPETSLKFPTALAQVTFRTRPPPPDDPLYRRFSVLRL
ncbi:hypothetical protein N9230_05560, partial [Akkermansiaceae bacterium]|nr:hypothetical protein [Akkermansiaceae bacterium]